MSLSESTDISSHCHVTTLPSQHIAYLCSAAGLVWLQTRWRKMHLGCLTGNHVTSAAEVDLLSSVFAFCLLRMF